MQVLLLTAWSNVANVSQSLSSRAEHAERRRLASVRRRVMLGWAHRSRLVRIEKIVLRRSHRRLLRRALTCLAAHQARKQRAASELAAVGRWRRCRLWRAAVHAWFSWSVERRTRREEGARRVAIKHRRSTALRQAACMHAWMSLARRARRIGLGIASMDRGRSVALARASLVGWQGVRLAKARSQRALRHGERRRTVKAWGAVMGWWEEVKERQRTCKRAALRRWRERCSDICRDRARRRDIANRRWMSRLWRLAHSTFQVRSLSLAHFIEGLEICLFVDVYLCDLCELSLRLHNVWKQPYDKLSLHHRLMGTRFISAAYTCCMGA